MIPDRFIALHLTVDQVNHVLFALQSQTQALVSDITRQAQAQTNPQPVNGPPVNVDEFNGEQAAPPEGVPA